MRVLLINTLYPPHVLGGAELSVQILAESLVSSGNEAIVVALGLNRGIRRTSFNGVKVYYVGIKNLYGPFSQRDGLKQALIPFWHAIDTYNPWMARAVEWIMRRESPHVVHTNNLSGFSVAVWTVAKHLGLPLIHTLRDYYLLCPRSTMFQNNRNCLTPCWYCRLYGMVRKRMTSRVHTVVGNSRFILKRHLKLGCFSQTPIRDVIFNAYPPVATSPRDRSRQRRPLALGYLGRLKPNKGIEFLLRTMQALPPEEYRLYLGGKDELRLKRRVQMRHVYFLGFVRPEAFFPKIDLLIVPSLWHDPLPRTIFEAYAYGKPVVGSNRGGIPEIIDTGKTGFVFEPDHRDTLLAVLRRLRHDPALLYQMSRSALAKSKAFLPEILSAKYLDQYRAIT